MFQERNALLDKYMTEAASLDYQVASQGMSNLATALELPLRKGVMDGGNADGIFEPVDFRNARCVDFPLDFIAPGTEHRYAAYTIPNCGYLPSRLVEGDYVTVPTYMVGNAISWCLKYQRDQNFSVVDRATEVFRDGFVSKLNRDKWHVILGAGLDRNIVVYDSNAQPRQLTKRLISLMQLTMRRNSGGNAQSMNKGRLTDLYVSPEGLEEIRNWNIDQVDDVTRREIFVGPNPAGISAVFGVLLHELDELGVNQEYQTYYTSTLSGTMAAGDLEIVVGLDLSRRDSFVMPVRQELEVYPDVSLHRQMKAGVYGWLEVGVAVLDSRRVLLGSM